MVVAFAASLGLGIAVARRPRSRFDALVNLVCFAGVSLPTFWLALILILVFAHGLGWLPASGIGSGGDAGIADWLRHLVAGQWRAADHRQHRRLYVLCVRCDDARRAGARTIRTARAKGASEARVVRRHATRRAGAR